MSCGMDVPGLLSGALSLASRGGSSSAASCMAPAELPPLQDWPAAGGLRGTGPRPSLQCELAAAAHGWPAMAAARGSPGYGSVHFGPPCLTTRGSAPGALGGCPAAPLRARRPPPAQASAWPATALPPAHPCSAAPARACSVASARGALDWAGGGVPGFPYDLDCEAELAAPLAPSLTSAAAPGTAISPFSVAAAFEMHGAFLGAAAAPFEALGPAASVAAGGAGGKWVSPRSAAGAVPGATAASSGSNASEDTAGLPLGLDFRTALATLQARPRRASPFWAGALRLSAVCSLALTTCAACLKRTQRCWLAGAPRCACGAARRAQRSCLCTRAGRPCLRPRLPGQASRSCTRRRHQARRSTSLRSTSMSLTPSRPPSAPRHCPPGRALPRQRPRRTRTSPPTALAPAGADHAQVPAHLGRSGLCSPPGMGRRARGAMDLTRFFSLLYIDRSAVLPCRQA